LKKLFYRSCKKRKNRILWEFISAQACLQVAGWLQWTDPQTHKVTDSNLFYLQGGGPAKLIFSSASIIFFINFTHQMRKSRLISNVVAILLLVALSQKIGFGIFYHNWQHAKTCNKTWPHSSASVDGAACTCIDDFSMPFTGPGIAVMSIPIIHHSTLFNSPSVSFCSNFYRCFHSLRAPPALEA
jgi:hypothetical protein